MQINLKPLIAGSAGGNSSLDFSFALDLSHLHIGTVHPFSSPVKVAGYVKRETAGLFLEYTADFHFQANCARCLEPAGRQMQESFSHWVVEAAANEEDLDPSVLCAPEGILDASDMTAADLLLSVNSVMFCREDCQGLCPKCGTNRNVTVCSCVIHEPDPRFDVLRKLMES